MTTTVSPTMGALAVGLLGLASPAAVDIFTTILTRGPLSRIAISRSTGLSAAAVTKSTGPWLAAGLIREGAPVMDPAATGGRPGTPIAVVADARLVVGIKITADQLYGVVTNLQAEVIDRIELPLASAEVEAAVVDLQRVVRALIGRLGERAKSLLGIGIAVPGDIDSHQGVVRNSPALGWQDVDLQRRLRATLSEPILIMNDVRALTLAEEWFGIGVDHSSFALLTMGAGVGCGVYVNGDAVAGGLGGLGELSHLPLADEAAVCHCGRTRCVEAVVSSAAVLAAARGVTGRASLTLAQAADWARGGNSAVARVYDRVGSTLGLTLATLANVVGPEAVLITGEGVESFDLVEPSLRREFEANTFGAARQTPVLTREHNFDHWARGAATAVIRVAVRGQL